MDALQQARERAPAQGPAAAGDASVGGRMCLSLECHIADISLPLLPLHRSKLESVHRRKDQQLQEMQASVDAVRRSMQQLEKETRHKVRNSPVP